MMSSKEHQPISPIAFENTGKSKDFILRWISPVHASRHRLSKLGDSKFVTFRVMVGSDDGRLVYMKNPKVACSSISAAIYMHNHGKPHEGNIHDCQGAMKHGIRNWEENLNSIKQGATVFSFVRNPVARARSAYINFFVDNRNKQASLHHPHLAARGFFSRPDHPYRFDIFLSYIEESLEVNSARSDGHWRPQVLNVGVGMVPLTCVRKLEDGLNDGLNYIAELAGVRSLSAPTHRLNQSSAIDFSLSSTQIAKIERIYAEDYEVFGY